MRNALFNKKFILSFQNFLLAILLSFNFNTVFAQDTTPPVITCPPWQELTVNKFGCLQTADFEVTATDDSGDPPTITNTFLYPGIRLGLGVYNDVFTATDAAGNSSSCTFRITVGTIQDMEAETQSTCDPLTNTYSQEIHFLANTIVGSPTLNINGQEFEIVANEFLQTVVLEGLPADGQPVDIVAYFPANGTDCLFTVEDLFTAPQSCDNIPPIFTSFPEDIIALANTADCQYIADFEWPTATDNVDPNPSITNTLLTPGMALGIGSYEDVFTATDVSGNSTSETFRITVGGITELQVGTQSSCDPWTNTYSQAISLVSSGITGNHMVTVNGESFNLQFGGPPPTIVLEGLPANGQQVNVEVYLNETPACVISTTFTAPADCSLPCDIMDIAAGEPYDCDPLTDTYSRDLEIYYQGTNLSTIQIEIDNDGNFISYPVENTSPQTITLTAMPSNGDGVNVFARIENACTIYAEDLFINPQNCTGPPTDCDISNLTPGTQSCDFDNNNYDQEIIVSYNNAPNSGTLLVKVDNGAWLPYPIAGSPQTILLEDLTPNGQNVDVFVKFSDDLGCTFQADNLFQAPADCTPPPVGGDVLFIVADANNLNGGDDAVKNRLEGLGYEVMLMSDENSQTSHANGKSLVIISNSVSSGQIGNKYTWSATPLINYETHLFDDLGMTSGGAFGHDNGERRVKVQAPAHPLANGNTGFTRVLSSDGQLAYGYPGSGATIIASTDGSDGQATIFAYESGASMSSGNAPAKRIGLFLKDSEVSKLNNKGWGFFDAAVCWATGCMATRQAAISLQSSSFSFYPNPVANRLHVTLSLSQDGPYAIDLYDLQGKRLRQLAKGNLMAGHSIDLELDLKDFPEGMYILQLVGNAEQLSKKVLIQR